MDCSCGIDVDYGDYGAPTLYTERIHTARKKHICGECRRKIVPGEKYENVTGQWDGEFATHKTCLDCLSLRDEFFSNGWGFGAVWSDFTDTISDWDYEVPEDCISALTSAARERVCQIIEYGWEDYAA